MVEGCKDFWDERSEKTIRSVLFIDQSTARDHAVGAILRRHNFLVTSVEDVRRAFDASADRRFDLIVLGYIVASTPALPDLIQSIRTKFSCPLICVGSHVTPEELAEIIAAELSTSSRKRGRRRVPKP
jgi:DNA-binding NtrC family response regulator